MKLLGLLAALFLLCIVLCCGFGAFLAPTTSTPGSNSIATSSTTPNQNAEQKPTTLSQSATPSTKVERILAERMEAHEQALTKWQAARDARAEAETELAALKNEIEELQATKPMPPKFEEREWSTVDKKYKTNAILIDTDNETATLRKPDGKTANVPKDQLIAESRIYIENAFDKLTMYRESLEGWKTSKHELDERAGRLMETIKAAGEPEPSRPQRQDVVAEVEAEEAKERERERLAKQEQERLAAKLAARKAEYELDVNGLVLMRKTVTGNTNGFGGTITGIVENRRSGKLSYAQITFNLYDESGAQVGSAMANINGLEPGGKWKFEATSFGKDFTTYKFSELTGF